MGERNELPAIFARTHSRFKTPTIALVVKTACIFILTVQSSFISAVAIATITRLIVYATTCVALPIFRRRHDTHEPLFKVPFGVAASVLSCVLIVWLLTSIDFAKEGISLAIWLGIGFIVFATMHFVGRRSKDDELVEDPAAQEILP